MAIDPWHTWFWMGFTLGLFAVWGFLYPATRAHGDWGHWYLGTIVGFVSTFFFWCCVHPEAKSKGMNQAFEQGGGLGDLMGFVVTFVPMHLLYEESMFDDEYNFMASDQRRRFFLGLFFCIILPPFIYIVMVPWSPAYNLMGGLSGMLCISSIWLAHGKQAQVWGSHNTGGGWGLFALGVLTFWGWLVPYTERTQGNSAKEKVIQCGFFGALVGIAYGGVAYHISADPNVVERISWVMVALAMLLLLLLRKKAGPLGVALPNMNVKTLKGRASSLAQAVRGSDRNFVGAMPDMVPYSRLTVKASDEAAFPGQVAGNLLDPGARLDAGPYYTNKWAARTRGHCWIEFTTKPAVALRMYRLKSANDDPGNDPKNWVFVGVDDQGNKTELSRVTNARWSHRWQWLEHTCRATPFKKFRLEISANNGAQLTELGQIMLLQGQASEDDPEACSYGKTESGGYPPLEDIVVKLRDDLNIEEDDMIEALKEACDDLEIDYENLTPQEQSQACYDSLYGRP